MEDADPEPDARTVFRTPIELNRHHWKGFKVATRLSEAGSTKAYAALLSLI